MYTGRVHANANANANANAFHCDIHDTFPPAKKRLALAAVCLTSLMFGLEISSVPTVLPILESVLRADFKEIQWIMNAYTLACTTVLMATGALADRFGRKRIYVASIVMFAVTSLICGLAQSAPVLIVSRFFKEWAAERC